MVNGEIQNISQKKDIDSIKEEKSNNVNEKSKDTHRNLWP